MFFKIITQYITFDTPWEPCFSGEICLKYYHLIHNVKQTNDFKHQY